MAGDNRSHEMYIVPNLRMRKLAIASNDDVNVLCSLSSAIYIYTSDSLMECNRKPSDFGQEVCAYENSSQVRNLLDLHTVKKIAGY